MLTFYDFSAPNGGTPSTDTSVQVRGGALGRSGTVIVQVWRGVDQTTPLDVTPTTATGMNTGRPNPPAITPTTSGAVIIAVGAGHSPEDQTPFSSSDLSNFIAPSTYGGAATYYGLLGMGSKAWTGGAFDPSQFGDGYTSTNAAWAALTLALRPAGTLSYVGGKSQNFSRSDTGVTVSLTSLSGGSDAAPQVGDIIIVAHAVFGAANYNLVVDTADYNEIADLYGDDNLDANLAVSWKLAG